MYIIYKLACSLNMAYFENKILPVLKEKITLVFASKMSFTYNQKTLKNGGN